MSDATDKLARSRAAIVQQIGKRQRRDLPRTADPLSPEDSVMGEAARSAGGWLGRMEYAVQAWWRHHPAHLAVDLATPVLRGYAERKPLQLLGISLALGAGLALVRPWRLISLTTLAVALVKSSHLPGLLMAAMSAADFQRDQEGPE